MFTPEDIPFGDAEARTAVSMFMSHIGWARDVEDRQNEIESYCVEVGQHRHALEMAIFYADSQCDESFLEEDELQGIAEDEDESKEARSIAKKELRRLARIRGRIEAKRETAQQRLNAFNRDQREFMVAYLNHRIHRRKSPAAKEVTPPW